MWIIPLKCLMNKPFKVLACLFPLKYLLFYPLFLVDKWAVYVSFCMQFTFCIKCYFIRVFPRAYLVQCILNDRFDGHIIRMFSSPLLRDIALSSILLQFHDIKWPYHLFSKQWISPYFAYQFYPNFSKYNFSQICSAGCDHIMCTAAARRWPHWGEAALVPGNIRPQLVHTCWLRYSQGIQKPA